MKRNLILAILSLAIGYMISSAMTAQGREADDIQKEISDKIVRFHVIANSDTAEDQALKLKVKNNVIQYIATQITDGSDLERTKEILLENKEKIIQIAEETIAENGYSYPVTAGLETTYFPTKSYGDVTFPPGYYEAFRIQIGKAEGKNWWCVIYPPLCFVDASHGVLPDSSKDELHSLLSDEEYDAITIKNYDDYPIKFRFKYLTFLNGIFS